jgi:hypothetical protein
MDDDLPPTCDTKCKTQNANTNRKMKRSLLVTALCFLLGLQDVCSFLNRNPRAGVATQLRRFWKHPFENSKVLIKKSTTPTFQTYHDSTNSKLNMAIDASSTSEMLSFLDLSLNIDRDTAEALAGPLFGASLFPYLAFLYFLNVEENECPKGVTVGFATCLLFVFLTIPAAIATQVLYGVSLADSDWLHGSAESLLTVTNLVTVVAFRQALNSKEKNLPMPASATSWAPMIWLVAGLTVLATATAIVPAIAGATVHTPWLAGFMDAPFTLEPLGANPEPENALTIAT